MYPGSTLFLDVGTQRDLWPGGAWPLLDAAAGDRVRALCVLGRELDVRVGGTCCAHETVPDGLPPHCAVNTPGAARIAGCEPDRPIRHCPPVAGGMLDDRASALYLDSGCRAPLLGDPVLAPVLAHMLAGVRDAVVFGAGVELGVAHVVEALLAARVRTHLVLDATGAGDAAVAQTLIARWKRRGVDVLTAATVARILRRAAPARN